MSYRIFVVDDDATNLRMAGYILTKNAMEAVMLPSGAALLEAVSEGGLPDLILMDINMPEMDGFETLENLRMWEHENSADETPVIFLTASEGTETETHGFEAGVSDYIKKPFNPDILLRRINNIVSQQDRIKSLRTEASTDRLTGLFNKAAAGTELAHACASEDGCLVMIDLDSFKLVNDLYGHEMGDKVLISFAKMISECVPEGSRCARIGGDEFLAFCKDMCGAEELSALADVLNERITREAKQLMGEDMDIPLGASLGGALVPECGREYETLLKLADKALYNVKENGKHGAEMYSAAAFAHADAEINSIEKELSTLSAIFGERNIPNSALRLDKQIFSSVYQYIMRYVMRNHRKACKLLLTVSRTADMPDEEFEELCVSFGDHIKNCLRKSDILMRNRHDQYFVLLADIREDSVGTVIDNIMRSWRELHGGKVKITYVTEFVGGTSAETVSDRRIIILDSDVNVLRSMGMTLSGGGFYVSAMRSEQTMFDYLAEHTPELILVSAQLTTLSCTDILDRLREIGGRTSDIPVIVLASDEQTELAREGLVHGACDVIRKPIIPEILLQRARNAIELFSLRLTMSAETDRKLRGSREMFLNVVRAFSEMIDEKDCYDRGHSLRVAEYAREIARRAGLSERRQNDIYTAALLHDMGKLGLPDEIIAKPSRLTDEEYELVKGHSEIGAKALESAEAMPALAAGARWHHERYAGGGYPDGLAGEDIPAEARIIAVADACAAMTGSRPYRAKLSAEQVAAELKKGRGTQFDPAYTDIMLEMIAEDASRSSGEE